MSVVRRILKLSKISILVYLAFFWHTQDTLWADATLKTDTMNRGRRAPPVKRLDSISREEAKRLDEIIEQQSRRLDQHEQTLAEQARVLEELKRSIRQQAAKYESLRQSLEESKAHVKPEARPSRELETVRLELKAIAERTSTLGQEVGNLISEREQAKQNPTAGWISTRPFIKSADGNLQVEFSAYGQLDFRGYQEGAAPPNTFVIRRAKLGMQGKLYKNYDFYILGDMADTAGTLLRDMYVNIDYRPGFQVRFGQFKVPFSQEELRSSGHQDFIERSMVNNLAPSRSPGVQIWGELLTGAVLYQIGTFNAKGLLAPNTSRTPEGVIRLRFTPWKNTDNEWVKGFSLGGALADGRTRGGSSIIGRTESRSFIFFRALPVHGEVLRTNGEFTFLKGPFALRAEYAQTNQSRTGLGPNRTNLPGVIAKGYMAQATYLLTGEAKPDNSAVVPKFAVVAEGGGPGAWELKFRFSNLQVHDGILGQRAEVFATGINWNMTKYVKYVLDLNSERFKNPLFSPRPGKEYLFTVLTRVQFLF